MSVVPRKNFFKILKKYFLVTGSGWKNNDMEVDTIIPRRQRVKLIDLMYEILDQDKREPIVLTNKLIKPLMN